MRGMRDLLVSIEGDSSKLVQKRACFHPESWKTDHPRHDAPGMSPGYGAHLHRQCLELSSCSDSEVIAVNPRSSSTGGRLAPNSRNRRAGYRLFSRSGSVPRLSDLCGHRTDSNGRTCRRIVAGR